MHIHIAAKYVILHALAVMLLSQMRVITTDTFTCRLTTITSCVCLCSSTCACSLNMSPFLQDKLLVRGSMHADSILILTSRSTALLRTYCDNVHEVDLLSTMLAEQLFAGYAFGAKEPCEAIKIRGAAVVRSCGGLPLAIEVSVRTIVAADAVTRHMHFVLVSTLPFALSCRA